MRPVLTAAIAALALTAAPADAATKSCGAILNPYPDTKWEGLPITKIRATGVTCRTARSVARGAHNRAIGGGPGLDGFKRLTWKGWKVAGDLRPTTDKYTATKDGNRVTWRF